MGLFRHLAAADFMRREFQTLDQTTPPGRIMDRILTVKYPHFVVRDGEGKLAGFLSIQNVREMLAEYDMLRNLVIAADIIFRSVVTIAETESLETSFHRFEDHPFSCLPVAAANDSRGVARLLEKRRYPSRLPRSRVAG